MIGPMKQMSQLARRNKPRVLGVAAALMLAACQTTQGPVLQTTLAVPETAPQAVAPVVGQLGAERLPQEAPQLVLKPKINDDPTQVVGMAPGELQSLLGRPEFVRRDMTAQVWQYRRSRCVLDLFLYGDEGTGPQVVHYEVRPLRHDASGLSDTAQRGCFAQLLLSGDTA